MSRVRTSDYYPIQPAPFGEGSRSRWFDMNRERLDEAVKMTLTELLPALHELPRVDKLRVIQLLATDIAREEGFEVAATEKNYPIWSPCDAFEGAATLLRVLNMERPN